MTYRQRANGILALSFLCFFAVFFVWYTHELTLEVKLIFLSYSPL